MTPSDHARVKSTSKGKGTAKRATPAAARKAKPPAKKAAKVVKAARTASRPSRATAKATAPAKRFAQRADLGAPVDGFFARQPAPLGAILNELRVLVAEAAPEAKSAIKWGMPFYVIDGETVCALAAFKSHVNLILPGAPGTFDDPGGRLEGDGKTGRHLKLRALDDLPRDAVRSWLRTAAKNARTGGRG
jgi:hypothetical protein